MISLAICSNDPERLYGTYEAAVLFSLETETELEIYRFNDAEEYMNTETAFDAVITDEASVLVAEKNACSIENCQELFRSFLKRS